jgi:hypothetical protein
MSTICCVHAREILDSRGNPTVEADVCLDNGVVGTLVARKYFYPWLKSLHAKDEAKKPA